jgi:hypothetical protein
MAMFLLFQKLLANVSGVQMKTGLGRRGNRQLF